MAEWHGHVCGHVALTERSSPAVMAVLRRAGIDGAIGVVARLLVDPDVRRRGVGRALLQTAQSAAVAQHRLAVLDVVGSHRAAVALYRGAGWVELGGAAASLPDGRELTNSSLLRARRPTGVTCSGCRGQGPLGALNIPRRSGHGSCCERWPREGLLEVVW